MGLEHLDGRRQPWTTIAAKGICFAGRTRGKALMDGAGRVVGPPVARPVATGVEGAARTTSTEDRAAF